MENIYLEYKSPIKENCLKAEIVSFLNSESGDIQVGVDDDGSVLSGRIVNYKHQEEKINNWIFNDFEPSIADLITVDTRIPFTITIRKGVTKDSFYKNGDGFNAKGVYIRIETSKRIRKLTCWSLILAKNSL